MNIPSLALIVFGAIELVNVLVLYLRPGSRSGNGLGVFNAYERSQKDPETQAFVSYLINWVAGTKLIIVVLVIGVIVAGDMTVKIFSIIALTFSVLTFFSRLYPQIESMDASGLITPKGYSRSLFIMIASMVLLFCLALIVFITNYYIKID